MRDVYELKIMNYEVLCKEIKRDVDQKSLTLSCPVGLFWSD